MSERLGTALSNIFYAEEERDLVLREDYPVGVAVQWANDLRRPAHDGVVIDHGYGGRIKVRNRRTGAERWIRASAIVMAMAAVSRTRRERPGRTCDRATPSEGRMFPQGSPRTAVK